MNDVNKPNVVLVLADQVSAGAIDRAHAPNLQRLSAESTVFERAYCASPLCVPSRMSLMTGLLPSQTGAIDNAGELPASVPTFAHRLRLRGYRTVLVGKMHFIGPDQLHGFEERPMTDVYPAGFDWVPDWELADDERLPWYHDLSSVLRAGPVSRTLQLEYDAEVLRRALDAIASADGPLLLVVSFTHPHDPYEVPREYWDRNEGDLPERPEPADDAPTRRLRTMVDADGIAVSDDQVRAARRGYYGAISLVDDYVGSILAALDDDAVVVFTSDHGDMLGERGLWYKMAPFEPSVRVPLIVRGLGLPGPVTQPVSLLEVGRMLETLELPRGGDIAVEYLAEGVRSPQVTLIRGSRKLIRTLGEPDLVYDLEADPHERENLGVDAELSRAADERWDLQALDRDVRTSQRARRLVKDALGIGRVTKWDHPQGDARYIDTGDDFWETLERARRASSDE